MEFHRLTCGGVAEVELSAVERLTGDEFAGAAIHIVAREGHAEGGKMHANLVGASGFEMDFQQRQVVSPAARGGHRHVAQRCPMGDGADAAFSHFPLDAVSLHNADGRVDGAAAVKRSLTDGVVDFVGVAVQERSGVAVFGGQHQSAGVAVKAVDDAEGGVRFTVGDQVGGESVGERVGDVFPRGMHRHAEGFVDNGDVFILIHPRFSET